MDVTVAIGAERDQIFVYVVTQPASRAHVVNLETIGTAAILASPAVTLQHFGAEFAIGIWVEANSRSSDLEAMSRVDQVRRAASRNYHPRGELRQGNRHKSSLSNSRAICSRRASAP